MTTTELAWTPVLEVFVAGVAAAQGSKRHVGGGRMIEQSKRVKPWREDVRAACLGAWAGTPPLDGPLRLVLDVVRKRPTSAPKRTTPPATTAPDLDKIIRSTADAISSAGVWVDDARIVSIAATKRLAEIGETPGAHIRVEVPS